MAKVFLPTRAIHRCGLERYNLWQLQNTLQDKKYVNLCLKQAQIRGMRPAGNKTPRSIIGTRQKYPLNDSLTLKSRNPFTPFKVALINLVYFHLHFGERAKHDAVFFRWQLVRYQRLITRTIADNSVRHECHARKQI